MSIPFMPGQKMSELEYVIIKHKKYLYLILRGVGFLFILYGLWMVTFFTNPIFKPFNETATALIIHIVCGAFLIMKGVEIIVKIRLQLKELEKKKS